MPQPTSPRTSQLERIIGLEQREAPRDKRLEALEKAHDAFNLKLDGALQILVQIKTALWLFGKIGGAAVGLAIIAGTAVSVLRALGH